MKKIIISLRLVNSKNGHLWYAVECGNKDIIVKVSLFKQTIIDYIKSKGS